MPSYFRAGPKSLVSLSRRQQQLPIRQDRRRPDAQRSPDEGRFRVARPLGDLAQRGQGHRVSDGGRAGRGCRVHTAQGDHGRSDRGLGGAGGYRPPDADREAEATRRAECERAQ